VPSRDLLFASFLFACEKIAVGTQATTLAMVASALALTRLIRKDGCLTAHHSFEKMGAHFS
jgi:hypothetical protein